MSDPAQEIKQPLTSEEMYAKMHAQFRKNAEHPYRWEWKYAACLALLKMGRDIKHVKDTIRVTYAWMIRQGLVKYTNNILVPAWTR